jgi:hypothetical protein
VRVPRDSWPYFTFSDSRLFFQSEGTGPRIYIPPRTGWAKIKVKVILRPAISQRACLGVRHPSGARDQFFFFFFFNYLLTVAGLLMWSALSDKKMDLLLTVAAGTRQRSLSRIRVPWDSWPYFTLSNLRLPHAGGPGCRIYFPLEESGPIISPGIEWGEVRRVRWVQSQSQSHVTTDGLSVSMSWCKDHSGTCDQILFSGWKLLCCLCGAPSLTRGRVCLLSVNVISVESIVNDSN